MKDITTVRMTLAAQIDTFASEMKCGAKHYLAAARTYVQSLDDYPESARDGYRMRFPNVTARTWDLFERIGRGTLTVAALFCGSDVVVNAVAKLPMKDQRRLLGDGVNAPKPQKVYNYGREMSKPVAEMNAVEIHRLIDVDHGTVRTMEGQKQKAETDERIFAEWKRSKYQIKNHKLFVTQKTSFTLSELEDIIERMR